MAIYESAYLTLLKVGPDPTGERSVSCRDWGDIEKENIATLSGDGELMLTVSSSFAEIEEMMDVFDRAEAMR